MISTKKTIYKIIEKLGAVDGDIDDLQDDIEDLRGIKTLWTGASQLVAADTATLSESVSAQNSGIILVWSSYDNEPKNSNWQFTYVPKSFVASHNGEGVDCGLFATIGFGRIGTKYVFVSNTAIRGHANNASTGTASGISFRNDYWVLRYVYGV